MWRIHIAVVIDRELQHRNAYVVQYFAIQEIDRYCQWGNQVAIFLYTDIVLVNIYCVVYRNTLCTWCPILNSALFESQKLAYGIKFTFTNFTDTRDMLISIYVFHLCLLHTILPSSPITTYMTTITNSAHFEFKNCSMKSNLIPYKILIRLIWWDVKY